MCLFYSSDIKERFTSYVLLLIVCLRNMEQFAWNPGNYLFFHKLQTKCKQMSCFPRLVHHSLSTSKAEFLKTVTACHEKIQKSLLSSSFPADLDDPNATLWGCFSPTNLSECNRVEWGMTAGCFCTPALWNQSAPSDSLKASHTVDDRRGMSAENVTLMC